MQLVNVMHALGDPTRRRLLESFHRARADSMTVDDASRLLQLDRTVAFDHLETLRSLGLKRIHDSVVQEDRPEIRGMVATVPHLVTVEEI